MDVGRLQLAWLDSFLAVAEAGSMTAAATSLHLSQPRISAHIASLEAAMGAALFDRGARGVTLTPLGLRLLPRARKVFDELQAAADDLDAARRRLQGRLRIGSYPGASAVLIAPLLARYRALHPSVEVDLVEGDAEKLDSAVLREQVDFAVRPSGPPPDPALSMSLLCREKVVAVVPERGALDPDAVADLSFVSGQTVIVSGAPHGRWADYVDQLRDAGAEPQRMIVATTPTTVTAFVRARLGFGILGAFAARAASGEGVMPVDLPAPAWRRDIHVVRTAEPVGKPSQAFLQMLRRRGPAQTEALAVW